MLCEKYFGLPLWVWLILVGIIVFNYNKKEKFTEEKTSYTTINY